jgi:uncharacterized protein YjeT (DUF2065 family)
MARKLKHLVLVTGMVCVLLGLGQFVLGSQWTPGAAMANATTESAERFAGGILIGFGLAWLWAARISPIPLAVVRFLAGVLLLGATGRIISITAQGWPNWFQLAQTSVEIVVPTLVLIVARVVAKQASR